MEEIEYRMIREEEMNRSLFGSFIRRQVINQCRRKVQGQWVVLSNPFIDDWNEEEYAFLITCLIHTIQIGGVVFGAFEHGVLKGFSSVESELFGSQHQYMDLTSIHVSQDMRGRGIGRHMFGLSKDWARAHGAKKLYISAHSAVESQAFYSAMGCKRSNGISAASCG